jgi:uncharacterized protein YkwD
MRSLPPPSKRRRKSTACALVLSVFAATATTGALAQEVTGCPADPRSVVPQVNAARADGAHCGVRRMAGAGALAWNERLREMAQAQATFLAETDALRHGGPNGQTVADRARSVGYPYSRVAENLALGAIDIEHALRAWTASEKHCVNLYEPRYAELALACTRGKGGQPLWVMVLGRPKGLPAKP